MDDLTVQNFMAFDVLTESLSVYAEAVEIQRMLDVGAHSSYAAGTFEVVHRVRTYRTDRHQQRHFVRCHIIDVPNGTGKTGFACDRRNVIHAVGGSADSHQHPDCVVHGFFCNDISGADILFPQFHDLPARFSCDPQKVSAGCGSGSITGKAHTQGLRNDLHRVGSSHHVACADARACTVYKAFQIFHGAAAFFYCGDCLVYIDEVNQFSLIDVGFHVTAGNNDRRDVDPRSSHDHSRNILIAGRDQDHGIQPLRARQHFDAVADHIAGDERIRTFHLQTIAEIHNVEVAGQTAGFANSFRSSLCQITEMQMSGIVIAPGIDDADSGLFQIFTAITKAKH